MKVEPYMVTYEVMQKWSFSFLYEQSTANEAADLFYQFWNLSYWVELIYGTTNKKWENLLDFIFHAWSYCKKFR